MTYNCLAFNNRTLIVQGSIPVKAAEGACCIDSFTSHCQGGRHLGGLVGLGQEAPSGPGLNENQTASLVSSLGEKGSRLENPNWFTTDSIFCTTCKHREAEAEVDKGSVTVNIEKSMDSSNNAKTDEVEAPGRPPCSL